MCEIKLIRNTNDGCLFFRNTGNDKKSQTLIPFYFLIDTYLLIFTLHILRSFNFQGLKLVVISGLFWGALHGLQSWPRFFAPAWSFFIYATAYETWRLKSFKKAFAAAAVTHALHNFLMMLAIGFDT